VAAARFAKLIKACLLQYLVQPPIEWVPWGFRQISAIPKPLLPLTLSACSHRHDQNPTVNRRLGKVIKTSFGLLGFSDHASCTLHSS